MQTFSHNMLTTMLASKLKQSTMSIDAICRRVQIDRAELLDMMQGKQMASPRMLARLSIIIEADWPAILAGYARWQFAQQKLTAQDIDRSHKDHMATLDIFYRLREAAKIIKSCPNIPAETLISEIQRDLQLEPQAIRNEIAHIRNQNRSTAHYDGWPGAY